jgi:hypothetical protein
MIKAIISLTLEKNLSIDSLQTFTINGQKPSQMEIFSNTLMIPQTNFAWTTTIINRLRFKPAL